MMNLLIFVLLFLSPVLGIKRGFGPGDQDYGYVTVRENAHMFWWLYHTTANVTDSSERPLILWLMGGPGGSGTGTANFMFIGPIDEYLEPREDNWVEYNNILFVDNPVGVGYSYVDILHALTINNTQIAIDLVQLMKGFYEAVPSFKNTPLYVYGISYGGKMGIEFAQLYNKEFEMGNFEAKLHGVAIGNAWISPVSSVLSWGPFLYQMSLVDERGLNSINEQANYLKQKLDNNQNYQATLEFFRTSNLVEEITDGVDFYNVMTKIERNGYSNENLIRRMSLMKENEKDYETLYALMNGPVKEALKIPDNVTWAGQTEYIFTYLFEDFMLPVTDIVEDLLNNTDIEIHVCNGNLDLIVDTPGQFLWIDKLNWINKKEFEEAERNTIWVNNRMEGYQQSGGGLSFYWLNVAGHNAIDENPLGTREFIKSVTGY